MARIRRIPLPPSSGSRNLDEWLARVTDALNQLPEISIFSTSSGPNTSGVSAGVGVLGIDIGSSSTKLWFNDSGTTDGWKRITYT